MSARARCHALHQPSLFSCRDSGAHAVWPCLPQVWPGEAVWPDYVSNANTSAWLTEQVASLYKQVPFGGLWYALAAAANFDGTPNKYVHCLYARHTADDY